jgi:hypothetical protein
MFDCFYSLMLSFQYEFSTETNVLFKQQNVATKSKLKNKLISQNQINDANTKTNNDTNNNQITNLNNRFTNSSYCLKETQIKNEIPMSNDQTKPQLSSSFPNTFNNMTILSNNTNNQQNSTIFKVNFSSTLLEPTKQTQTATSTNTTNPSINTITSTSSNNGLKLNYKDIINFDTTSSSLDPFNDAELKTINDLEELKNILENHKFESSTANNEILNHSNNSTGIDGANSSLFKNSISKSFLLSNNNDVTSSTTMPSNLTKSTTPNSFQLDSFGLPKISFVDLDNK